MSNGKLGRIWLKRARKGPMDERTSAYLKAGRGLEGNANQGGKRQVIVISADSWREMTDELGTEIPPAARRANLLVSGVELAHSRGKILRVGACRLLIHGETRPCERMEEVMAGLRKAMAKEWRGGAFGEVLDDGIIAVGDAVSIEET